jgi:hypothetical protein
VEDGAENTLDGAHFCGVDADRVHALLRPA